MNTTLNEIRSHRPCEESWERLLREQGKTQADDELLPYSRILEICGLNDTLWAIAHCHPRGPWVCAEFSLWCAEGIRHMIEDPSPIAALDTARKYLDGDATQTQLRESIIPAWAAIYLTGRAADRAAAFAADCVEELSSSCSVGSIIAYAANYAAIYAEDCSSDWDAARTAQRSKLLGLLEEMP